MTGSNCKLWSICREASKGMQSIFRQLWQWLKRFFGQLFGIKSSPTSAGTSRRLQRETSQEASATLSDTDYEFLFSELLEGVAHGWHEGRILKFFEKLGDRGKQSQWVAWLQRFGAKVLASSAPNHQLAARMMRLGELAQSFPAIREIGHTSYTIGRQLFTRDSGNTIWEYDGPDTEAIAAPAPPIEYEGIDEGETGIQESDFPAPADELETLTLEQLLARLQQDADLTKLIAQQLSIETADPQVIIETLINQLNQASGETENQPIPNTVEGWFSRGLEQAN
ncbi:MAG: tetratricopeptide repeat protein, partial [Microcystaceae cyanobacterium]